MNRRLFPWRDRARTFAQDPRRFAARACTDLPTPGAARFAAECGPLAKASGRMGRAST